MSLRHVLLSSVLISAVITTAVRAQAPLGLRDGDTIVFYGDSITHHHHYVAYVSLFFATRYPDIPLHFYNAGIGGNRTSSALPRFRQDVAEQNPAVVAVLFGMNDGNRQEFSNDTFQKYQQGMQTILERIRAETKARTVVLLKPTYYDHRVAVKHLPHPERLYPEYNQVLVRFGDYLDELGRQKGFTAIDLNTPMKDLTRRLRETDPQASLTRDGIHPLPEGHFAIAYAVLKGLGVTGTVSDLHVDVSEGIRLADRCVVSDLKLQSNSVRFSLLQNSLPYPHPSEARVALGNLPFDEDLNRERLRVTGLERGKYTLSIDDEKIGLFTASQLDQGINLALLPATPQYQQAMRVFEHWQHWRGLVKKHRDFRYLEKARGYRRTDGTYPHATQGVDIIGPANEVIDVTKAEWQAHFDSLAANAAEVLRQIAQVEATIHETARPISHRYQLELHAQ